jgi:molybdate transport system ATP-binding protein
MAAAGMTLDAHVVVDRGRLSVDVRLAAAPGEVVVLLGPNGAGKTTVLSALAGLVRLRSGHVRLGGSTYDDDGTALPPHLRRIGLVPQGVLLFPHLDVGANVAFGPRRRGVRKPEAHRRAIEELGRLGIADLAGARPAALSGGQAQKVALARALAGDPALLLLDEPLAALDARTRIEVRTALRHRLAEVGAVTVLVTHDPLDAMVLGDRLVVVEDGQVVQEGAPGQVARRPRTDYVARLVGLNLLAGVGEGDVVRLPSGAAVVPADAVSGPALVAFAPSAVSLHASPPGSGSPRNVWAGRVAGVEAHGSLVRVEVLGDVPLVADVTAAAAADLGLLAGAAVWASVKAVEVTAYPA